MRNGALSPSSQTLLWLLRAQELCLNLGHELAADDRTSSDDSPSSEWHPPAYLGNADGERGERDGVCREAKLRCDPRRVEPQNK